MNEDSCTITSTDPGCLKGNHPPLGGHVHVLRPPPPRAAGCRTGQGVPGRERGDGGAGGSAARGDGAGRAAGGEGEKPAAWVLVRCLEEFGFYAENNGESLRNLEQGSNMI